MLAYEGVARLGHSIGDYGRQLRGEVVQCRVRILPTRVAQSPPLCAAVKCALRVLQSRQRWPVADYAGDL